MIVDAGVGTASDVAIAMELGFDAVLMNSAIAMADDPTRMAVAMKMGVGSWKIGLFERANQEITLWLGQ